MRHSVGVWIDATDLLVEGLGWSAEDRAHPYDRLPARAEAHVTDVVWQLSRCAAGVGVRFVTDSATIVVRWRVIYEELSLPRFAATGHSGVDLYTRDGSGPWRYLGTGLPESHPENEATLADGLAPVPHGREFLLNLPLFNGVERIEIGVERMSTIRLPEAQPAPDRAICAYGTSIVQGACASRPGMTHLAQLRRRLDRPFVNLGLAGNGQMHPEIAALLAELDAGAFVIDCLPNMDVELLRDRGERFLATLAAARPEVPIMVVGSIEQAGSQAQPALAGRQREITAAQDKIVGDLRQAGHTNLLAVPGAGLLGDDDEATVDSVHPSDLGFARLSDHFADLFGRVLERKP